VTALVEIISEVRGALGVGVEAFTDLTILVQLPNDNDGLHYHSIRGSKLALDAVVSGLIGVSSPLSPEVALRRAKETKFEKYAEGWGDAPTSASILVQSRNLVLSSATPRLSDGAGQGRNRL
jgi:hypothetical protein